MDDALARLKELRAKLIAEENVSEHNLKVGDIIYVSLGSDDGLILRDGFSTRYKYLVIVGFTSEGNIIGSLLINSNINQQKWSQEFLDCQYPLLHKHYLHILDYTSWLDCTELFEFGADALAKRGALLKGALTEEDKQNVLTMLRNSEVIDKATKRRFGLL